MDEQQNRNELMAVLELSHESLAALLQLPPGAYIDGAHAPHDRPGILELRVRGAGWQVSPGMVIPKITGTATRYEADNGETLRTVIDWGLPPSHG